MTAPKWKCPHAPKGWRCTRVAPHLGPCAAVRRRRWWQFTRGQRARMYEVGAAAATAAGTWGVVDGQKAAALLYVFAAVLGVARGNVPPAE